MRGRVGRASGWLVLLCALVPTVSATVSGDPAKLAKTYVGAVEAANRAIVAKKGKLAEEDADLPSKATKALATLLEEEDVAALRAAADAALELDRLEDFEALRDRMVELEASLDATASRAVSRERFLVIAENGLSAEWAEDFADVCDAVLDAYDELFGFEEWSKVPGKKMRVRVHLEDEVTKPPHFAPHFPFHSEIDLPVLDAETFRSPSADGKFFFYGLCHEFGHLIAMWGDRGTQEDHHSWAHYTGVVVCEHCSEAKSFTWKDDLRDARWRSATKERERVAATDPSKAGADEVLAMLFALEDLVGTKGIGEAMNLAHAKGRGHRINHVRYLWFDDLAWALAKTAPKKRRKDVKALLER